MFQTGLAFAPNNGIGSERNIISTLGASLYTNTVNGLVLGNGEILAPRPRGPDVGAKIFLLIQKIYRKLGFEIVYVDNWNSRHTWGGEVHRGTNVVREGGERW